MTVTRSKSRRRLAASVLSILLSGLPARAENIRELATLSLEELLALPITSASKHSEPLDRTAAASFVITKEDIRRSGATALPEILRMVPGLNVARVAPGEWAVSARGFNGVFADRLLVMIDGRTIYTSIFSGTFWDEHDLVLEDIARIEVVRGPGATLWGANAVNGIINIITESAESTVGALASGVVGTKDRLITTARAGGAKGNASYRVFGKYSDRASTKLEDGEDGFNGWETARSGARIDIDPNPRNRVSLEGEGFYTEKNWDLRRVALDSPTLNESVDESRYGTGGHARARWTGQLSDTSEMALQSYFDHVKRDDTVLQNRRDTFDVDFQHRFRVSEGNELLWGADYRHYDDSFGNTFTASVVPTERAYDLITGFVQNELSPSPDLKLILGTKLEHNYSTDLAIQPNARAIWSFEPNQSVWAAVSRAVRTSARFNQDGRLVLAFIFHERFALAKNKG